MVCCFLAFTTLAVDFVAHCSHSAKRNALFPNQMWIPFDLMIICKKKSKRKKLNYNHGPSLSIPIAYNH